MKYRFQIVASAYHKGRLQISYDPQVTGNGEFITQYNYIVDLAKERDFTVEIGWGSELGAAMHKLPGLQSLPHGTTPFAALTTEEYRNGIVSVRVLNDLTSPNDTVNNDIQVNVFVSAGDDIEVYVPDQYTLGSMMYTDPGAPAAMAEGGALKSDYGDVRPEAPTEEPTKGELQPQGGESEDSVPADSTAQDAEQSAPMALQPSSEMAPAPSHVDCFDHVYFGDPITSFRTCLKRYQLHSFTGKTISTLTAVRMRFPNFPPYRGDDADGLYGKQGGGKYNYAHTTLLNYLTPAFVCRRGGIRWKYQRVGGSDNVSSQPVILTYEPTSFGGYEYAENGVSTILTSFAGGRVSEIMNYFSSNLWPGAVMNLSAQNPSVEAEMPYYINRRFSPAKRKQTNVNELAYDTFHRYYTIWEATGGRDPLIMREVSVGEDFNLAFFTGAPILYYLAPDENPQGFTS